MFLATLTAMAILPGLLGWSGSVVQSGSMEPNMSAGDVVLTSKLADTAPLPLGRVITFLVDDTQVVHRLVTVGDDNTIVTAGDANPEVDPWSPAREDITGQARILVPAIGLPSLWIGTGNLFAFAIWASATAIALLVVGSSLGGSRSNAPGARRAPGGRSGRPWWPRRSRVGRIALGTTVAVVAAMALPMLPHGSADAAFSGQTRASASWSVRSQAPVTVGSMAGYGIIAASAITDDSNNGFGNGSFVRGSVATTPGTTVIGYKAREIDGRIDLANAAARNAMAAATAARSALHTRAITATIAPTLSGTLSAGVYASSTGAFSVPGRLVLDARGDPGAQFVFRPASTLTMAARAQIVLVNGARAENVWWVVGTTATLGSTTSSTDTIAAGSYLVSGDARLRGVSLSGRVVSFNGSVHTSVSVLTPAD